MKTYLSSFAMVLLAAAPLSAQVTLSPPSGASDVNPDTRLRLVFEGAPPLQNKGKIRVYDAADDRLVDELDMSIPPGPRNTRTPAPYDTFHYDSVPDTVFTVNNPDDDPSHVYQQNYVGGTSQDSARHFFPVLVEGNTAIISLHNNKLSYGKTYYVEIPAETFQDPTFAGISGKQAWRFSTQPRAPAVDSSQVVVSADGTGDFSTVQGAIDWVPSGQPGPREIFIRSGTYEEIVVLRDKQGLTLRGEGRDSVIVRYANNGVFNRVGRYEFTLTGSSAVNLVGFTIQSVGKDENPAQAEALFVRGDKYQVHHVTMLGSGDALQIQADTRLFVSGSSIRGYGDNLLSYGAAFFKRCELISTYGPHGWPRNPQSNHGDVFVDTTFSLEGEGTSGDGHCTLARSPASSSVGGVNFPFAEFVLINCKLQGIAPEGWGAVGQDYNNVHFWEYNSVNLSDGKPVDVSRRAPWSRQLTMERDAETIASYSDPSFVLAGWTPELAPVLVRALPESLELPEGGNAELAVEVAAEPEATYQWSRDGQPLPAETNATLTLQAITAATSGEYSVSITNRLGTVTASARVVVGVGGAQPTAAGASAGAQASSAGAVSVAVGAGAGGTAQASQGGAGALGSSGAAVVPATSLDGGGGGDGGEQAAAAPLVGQAQPAADGGNGSAERARSGGCSVGTRSGFSYGWTWLWVALAIVVHRRQRAYGHVVMRSIQALSRGS